MSSSLYYDILKEPDDNFLQNETKFILRKAYGEDYISNVVLTNKEILYLEGIIVASESKKGIRDIKKIISILKKGYPIKLYEQN